MSEKVKYECHCSMFGYGPKTKIWVTIGKLTRCPNCNETFTVSKGDPPGTKYPDKEGMRDGK